MLFIFVSVVCSLRFDLLFAGSDFCGVMKLVVFSPALFTITLDFFYGLTDFATGGWLVPTVVSLRLTFEP